MLEYFGATVAERVECLIQEPVEWRVEIQFLAGGVPLVLLTYTRLC